MVKFKLKKVRVKIKSAWIRLRVSLKVLFGKKFIAITLTEKPDDNFYRAQFWDSGNVEPDFYKKLHTETTVYITNKYFQKTAGELIGKVNNILRC